MTIEGDYTTFAHLETVVLGTLARRTLIATNTARVVEAANGKPIIFMPARHDHHRVQTGDGYAAFVAGALDASRLILVKPADDLAEPVDQAFPGVVPADLPVSIVGWQRLEVALSS